MKGAIYNASAGSGKTYRLAYKYVRDVIASPQATLYRNILAVTFTNKATEEMKRRILLQIHTLASGRGSSYLADLKRELNLSEAEIRRRAGRVLSNILHGYSRFTVLTIDRFFQRILRAFIMEIGLDLAYSLEIENASLIEQGVDALIDEITEDEGLRKWLFDTALERMEDGGTWNIRETLLKLSSSIFSEKARNALENSVGKEVLQQNIQNRSVELKTLEQQMRLIGTQAMEKITADGVDCNSFKGSARSVAHQFRLAQDGASLSITETRRAAVNDEGAWLAKGKKTGGVQPSPQLVTALQSLFAELIDVNDVYEDKRANLKLMRENYRSFALMGDISERVERLCNEQNIVLLNQTANILSEFLSESDAPFIYEKVGTRFSHYMIDEFQDTSRHEWRNFLPLLQNTLSECPDDESRLLIVGDIKQSIYRWRGGDWRLLHSQALEDLGEEQMQVVNMADNYRSLAQVVNFNNEVIEKVVQHLNADLNTHLEESGLSKDLQTQLHGMLAQAYSEHAQTPRRKSVHDGFVEVVEFEEQPPIVECICSAIDRGFRPCDIMILARTNSEARDIANVLMDFKRCNTQAKYHFDVMTQEALIIGSAAVSRFIIAVMQLALNPDDRLALALYNQFLGAEFVDAALSEEALCRLRHLRSLSPVEAFESVVMDFALDSDVTNVAFVQALHEQVINFSNTRVSDLALFCEWWLKKGCEASLNVEQSESAIEILTIHKAKGLEKSVVLIPYCKWDFTPKNSQIVWALDAEGEMGILPVKYVKEMGKSSFAEEYYHEMIYSCIDAVNLLYVALTRAAESLHVFISKKKRGTHIGDIILSCVEQMGAAQTTNEEQQTRRYAFGEPAGPVAQEEAQSSENFTIEKYSSRPAGLRLRMPSAKYREEGTAPRELGVLLHKAFEKARSTEDIERNVEQMLLGGHINHEESLSLRKTLGESLKNPLIASWFSPEWEDVRNESDILLPNDATVLRPDRVMTRGEEAVIVDYKFGRLHSSKYTKQMQSYKACLEAMGYTKVSAYIWYIRSGEVDEV